MKDSDRAKLHGPDVPVDLRHHAGAIGDLGGAGIGLGQVAHHYGRHDHRRTAGTRSDLRRYHAALAGRLIGVRSKARVGRGVVVTVSPQKVAGLSRYADAQRAWVVGTDSCTRRHGSRRQTGWPGSGPSPSVDEIHDFVVGNRSGRFLDFDGHAVGLPHRAQLVRGPVRNCHVGTAVRSCLSPSSRGLAYAERVRVDGYEVTCDARTPRSAYARASRLP